MTLRALGAVNALCVGAYAILSWGLAAAVPLPSRNTQRVQAYRSYAERLGLRANSTAYQFLTGDLFATPTRFAFAYVVPQLVSTAACIIALRKHRKFRADSVERWAISFAIIASFSVPILAQDFWLSFAWGQMAATGLNPYYVPIDPALVVATPLDNFAHRMTYGPLWALVSGAVVFLSLHSAAIAGIVFKLMFLGLWWCMLRTLRRMLPEDQQAKALIILGWLPLGVLSTLADGHNDVWTTAMALGWLYFLERGRYLTSAAALTASILVKYISAPLGLLHVLHASRHRSIRRLVVELVAVASFATLVFLPFFRGLEFFTPLKDLQWHLFSPEQAIMALFPIFGKFGTNLLKAAYVIFFAALAIISAIQYYRVPSPDRLRNAALAFMCAVLFRPTFGHVWPWYVLWALPFAALVSSTTLSRWIVGVAIAMPFPVVMAVAPPGTSLMYRFFLPSLAVYGFAVLWLYFGRDPHLREQ